MGRHRDEIEGLSNNDPMIRHAMHLVYCGEMSYEEAMEALVVAKHKESEWYKQQLIDRMQREGSSPITMPIDEFCKRHCRGIE